METSSAGSVTILPIIFLILPIILIALTIFVMTKFSGRTLAIILGAGCLSMVIAYLNLNVFRQEVTTGKMSVIAETRTISTSSESTAELWDKLTRSRIQLGDVKSEAQDTTKEINLEETETAKQAQPEWVDWPSVRTGNLYRQVVVSDPFSTVDECFVDLEDRFQGVVRLRMQRLLDGLPGSPFAIPAPSKMGIGIDYIMSDICREEYTETVDSSVGDMRRVHVLMEFDSKNDHYLRSSWQRYERISRLKTVGGIASLALGGLAMVFGLLKFDTWTRGYYTKRLLIGVPAAIIVVVLLLVS